MSKTFSWLHLSDLHMGQEGQRLWPNFRGQFYDDLRYLLAKTELIQLVIFSGDLTQKAKPSEFEALNEELMKLWEVFAEFGSTPFLFPVPGNHDLTRPDEKLSQVKGLKKWYEDVDVSNELFSGKNNQYLSVITQCFENYTKWYSSLEIPVPPTFKGLLPGDSSCVIEVNGLKVGLVGLNSSFIQLTGEDYLGKLLVSPTQLSAVTNDDATTWCSNNDFNFLVTHHPSDWLHSAALNNFEKEINKPGRFVAHLHGHMHEAGSRTYSRNGGGGKRASQASSLFGLETWGESSENKRIHGYSLNQLKVDGESLNWKIWPRVRIEGVDDDRIAPNHAFHLIRGEEFLDTPIKTLRQSTSTSSETSLRKVDMSSESESQKGAITLSNSQYRLLPSEHHLKIRKTEQQSCNEALSKAGIAWISADWGVGRDGFIWSVLKRLGKEKLPVYRIELGHYDDRTAFLDAFASKSNCSFTDYCRSLGNAGPTIFLFDEAPTSSGDVSGKYIEEDVESLVEIAKSYLPETIVLVISRGLPKQSSIPSLKLELLEEPDTRLYLESQSSLIAEEITSNFVSQVQRKTEGLIARIDQLIRQLQVVNLADIDPPELSVGTNVAVIASTSVALIKTISELESSKNPLHERAYLLLQILALLPNGESVHELKHIDPIRPIFADHALQLYDRDLIDSRSVSALIGQGGVQSSVNKLMVIPPQVREYVLSRMDERQITKLVKLAADRYFGKTWASGTHRPSKITQIASQDSGGISGNPHSLLLRMLGDINLQTRKTYTSSVLKVCVAYCSSLRSADQYRRVVSVATEMLALIPEEFSRERHAIEINLVTALRMSGQDSRALPVLENLLKSESSTDIRRRLLLNKALCLQSLRNDTAILVAEDIIKMAPKSSEALQAKSIVLEMQDDQSNEGKLLLLERQSRQGGHSTVANNLTLNRIKNHTDPSAISTLRTVYESSKKANDLYNAHRAATKIARFSYLQNGKIEQEDLRRLMTAYHYFYGERFGALFTNSHKALWDYFETVNEVENQLVLFRHSSFVWRLNGHEDKEKNYLTALEAKKNEVLLLGERIDKNVLYFLNRSEYQGSRLEDQSKKLGE
jgi:hypothetical protein